MIVYLKYILHWLYYIVWIFFRFWIKITEISHRYINWTNMNFIYDIISLCIYNF